MKTGLLVGILEYQIPGIVLASFLRTADCTVRSSISKYENKSNSSGAPEKSVWNIPVAPKHKMQIYSQLTFFNFLQKNIKLRATLWTPERTWSSRLHDRPHAAWYFSIGTALLLTGGCRPPQYTNLRSCVLRIAHSINRGVARSRDDAFRYVVVAWLIPGDC